MSSVTSSTQQHHPQHAPETTTKKKFGKNLNKLTQPPPPVAKTGAKTNANSRNGLLLLSTKRTSSSNAAASTTGGILASKPTSQAAAKPRPSLGLHNQSSTSTHDALLGAVVGASRAETQPHDAWGVAEKQKSPTGEIDASFVEDEIPDIKHSESYQNEIVQDSERHNSLRNLPPGSRYSDLPSSDWDLYGGRSAPTDRSGGEGSLVSPENGVPDDEQKTAMAALAKDRAEKRRTEEETRQNDQKKRAAQRLLELEEKMGTADDSGRHQIPIKARTLYDPNKHGSDSGTPLKDERSASKPYSPEPQAHGDNRDIYARQPIQFASYDDRERGERGGSSGPRMLFDPKSGSMVAVPSRDESGAGGKGRKERGKKGKNTRERVPSKNDSRQENEGGKNGRKGKREKKIESSPAKADSKKGKTPSSRKLPRTCGVLYSRDSKGNFVCSDGCDGDLGYGAHSVPGGRTKNAEAYSNFLDDQEKRHQDELYEDDHLETSYDADGLYDDAGEVAIVPEPAEVKFDWLKPSDKIELITGIDDSPTLQATAKEWAPSHAYLVASTARVDSSSSVEKNKMTSVEALNDDEEEEDDGPFGLGFDPTVNMDSVMQSPSAEPTNGLDTVDLTSLSLEPAYQGATQSNHIFAFGTGATWGASDAGGSNANWGVPASSGTPASFLSLSSGNSWGGVAGLGKSSLGGSSLNGDHQRPTID